MRIIIEAREYVPDGPLFLADTVLDTEELPGAEEPFCFLSSTGTAITITTRQEEE